MILRTADVLELWHHKMSPTDDFEDFLARFTSEHTDELDELDRYERMLLTAKTDDGRVNAKKIIRIKKIVLNFRLKMAILSTSHRREFAELHSRLLREKLETATCLCFRMKHDNTIEVFFRSGPESWMLVDGGNVLPCSFHLLARSKWTGVLHELEQMINATGTTERDLQKFFEVNPELLAGNSYDTVIPQAVIVPESGEYHWKADFVLSPFNQFDFATILELKLPSVETVITKKPAHHSFSAQVWHGIQQVRDYATEFDNSNVRTRFRETYNVDIFKPDLHLVIGRRWDIAQVDSVRGMKRSAQVRVESWDEILERLKREFS
jgi:hypothetical protein